MHTPSIQIKAYWLFAIAQRNRSFPWVFKPTAPIVAPLVPLCICACGFFAQLRRNRRFFLTHSVVSCGVWPHLPQIVPETSQLMRQPLIPKQSANTCSRTKKDTLILKVFVLPPLQSSGTRPHSDHILRVLLGLSK